MTRGHVANGYLTTAALPEILAQLGHATVHVLSTAARHAGGRFNAEVIGAGRAIYLVNAADIHFGWCTPHGDVDVQPANLDASTGVRFTRRASAPPPSASGALATTSPSSGPAGRSGIGASPQPGPSAPPPSAPWTASLFGSSGASWMPGPAGPSKDGPATTSSPARAPTSLTDLAPERIIRYLRWRDPEGFAMFLAEGGYVERLNTILDGRTGQLADLRAVAAHLLATASIDLAELLRVEADHLG